MYEYKVDVYKVKEAEDRMNELAKEDWRVITVSHNEAMGFGLIVVYERKNRLINTFFTHFCIKQEI